MEAQAVEELGPGAAEEVDEGMSEDEWRGGREKVGRRGTSLGFLEGDGAEEGKEGRRRWSAETRLRLSVRAPIPAGGNPSHANWGGELPSFPQGCLRSRVHSSVALPKRGSPRFFLFIFYLLAQFLCFAIIFSYDRSNGRPATRLNRPGPAVLYQHMGLTSGASPTITWMS